jgi:antitoxin component of MazEF toxin-antitoxin module
VRKSRYRLGALLAQVRKANLHSETRWGEPTGKEVW